MITKELFIKMMDAAEKFSEEVDRWSNFGIDVYDLPIGFIPWEMFDCWVDSHFDVDGQDWIDWYLWERKSLTTGEILPCYDENDSEFYVKDPSDLWELVVSHIINNKTDSSCPFYKSEKCTNS